MITAAGATHRGRVRPINEDVYLIDLELGLFAVADGMGGHNAGEVASRLAVDTVRAFVAQTQQPDDITWPFGFDAALSVDGNRLLTAIRLANRGVFEAGQSRDDYAGMGTTLAAGLIDAGRLVFCGVGDSRIYSLSGGRLLQLTEDETWTAMLRKRGEPSPGANHPMSHVLTNVIGARDRIDCQIVERDLEGPETLLFCTDGVHGAIDAATIARLLGASDPAAAAEHVVQHALEAAGTDNITAVVVRYGGST